MNILFVSYFQVRTLQGGTGRVTDALACEFKRLFNHNCHSLYMVERAPEERNTHFDSEIHSAKLSADVIADTIRRLNIDIVISQELNNQASVIREGVDSSGRKCKVVYVHHSTPMAHEKAFLTFSYLLGDFRQSPSLKTFLRMVTQPVYRPVKLYGHKKAYKNAYEMSDAIVLLSDRFIDPWLAAAGVEGDYADRMTSIPNSLSFDDFADQELIGKKERRVLVVSRMSEVVKRTSLVLKAWQEIQDVPELSDWQLDIVGDGADLASYKEYASKYLKRVNFYGQQRPKSFYEKSSIFLMTSSFEGWGLTLTEAGQLGCGVVAIDSYLSLRDIITDGENGILVPEGDFASFVKALKELMSDEKRRVVMGIRGVELAKRFSKQNVATKWNDLFNRLLEK